MALSKRIMVELPALRRFGRALAGGPAEGDAQIEALLTAILTAPEEALRAQDLKRFLYRKLVDGFHERGAHRPRPDGTLAEQSVRHVLNRIAPRPRMAFLLKSLEGFCVEEIADILQVSDVQARLLVELGSTAIAEQLRTDVLIIEDEPLIAFDLQDIVEELGHRVTGIARTLEEALKLVTEKKPGLILSDIRLADGSSGLDAVNMIIQSLHVPVIFITAFPEQFLKGLKPEPAGLISKPFLSETVRALVSQALFFDRRAGMEEYLGTP